jgi:hypothetical protein
VRFLLRSPIALTTFSMNGSLLACGRLAMFAGVQGRSSKSGPLQPRMLCSSSAPVCAPRLISVLLSWPTRASSFDTRPAISTLMRARIVITFGAASLMISSGSNS